MSAGPAQWLGAGVEAAARDLAGAEQRVEAMRNARDRAIRSAVNGGMTLRAVAELAGLSAAQVLNITRGHRGGS